MGVTLGGLKADIDVFHSLEVFGGYAIALASRPWCKSTNIKIKIYGPTGKTEVLSRSEVAPEFKNRQLSGYPCCLYMS